MAKHESFMHKLKEKLFHGDHVADADWDTSYTKFKNLTDSMHKLKAGAHNYAASIYSVILNSNNTAVEFAALLEDQAVPNDYQGIVKELRTAHAQLNGDKQQALTTKLQESVLQPIDTHIQSLNQIHAKVARRDELHENLEYYITKVAALNKDRDERSAKGKAETSANIDKHDRNIVKLDAARSDYTAFATTLEADLNTAWNGRVQVLGPVMAAFVEVEKGFVELYGNSLSMIHHSNQLQQAPEGISLAPVLPSQVSTPAIAQSLGPMPVSSHTGATNEAVSAAHHAEMQQQQQAPLAVASTVTTTALPYAQPATTPQPPHVEQNPFSTEVPAQQQQQQQAHQQQATTQHIPPHEVAAGGAQSAGPIDHASNQNPFEQSNLHHEGGVVHLQPQQQHEIIPARSPKAQYEEESKAQRFAEEQKQHEQLA